VAEVSLTLEIGAAEQVVEVVASAELVSTTTSDLATTWQNRQVTELPNFSATGVVSDPRNLAILQAGVTSQPGGVVGEGGSIGGMTLMSTLLSMPLAISAGRWPGVNRFLQWTTGFVSLGLGVAIVLQAGVVRT